MNLPWTYTVEEDVDNEDNKIYIVSVNELPGIQTGPYTREEVFELIEDAMQGAFELYMKLGKQIPEPKSNKKKCQLIN
ncbi:hypothetical protein A3F66_05425 [candidate division TM6 bacterium RIFCSPHIGHO2_12_FULL_32_22]|nr:MAG: hypothetical protein A3F66_05425 [candidate division TM6 bacterium RIFCSPHIGHO2_12_FULL_32_22]